METVLQRIKRAKLTIKPSKCKFAQQNVKILGHIVGQGFRTPSEIKVQAVLEFPTSRTKTQIRAFLGLVGYYQKYINLFSVIAAPLTDALKGRAKKGEITWTTEYENAFRELKGKLIDKPVLYAPNFEREFILFKRTLQTQGVKTDSRVAIIVKEFGAPLTIGEAYLKIIMSSFLGFCEGDTRNRWHDGQVCPDVDKELWRLGPDGSGVFWRWTSVSRCGQGTMAPWARRLGNSGEEKDKRVRERERTEGGGETEKKEQRRKETERESGRESDAHLEWKKGLSPEIGVKKTMNAGGVEHGNRN
ncbi:retrovirus-related Pol polyprotein from transposon 297 [Trichonephila clavipes]|nr:retrovirus-related Pol polyprotein from transposon 297 [Trichonephila clavipes]